MEFRGGGQIEPPPQRILVFKYPSRDRVNVKVFKRKLKQPDDLVLSNNPFEESECLIMDGRNTNYFLRMI